MSRQDWREWPRRKVVAVHHDVADCRVDYILECSHVIQRFYLDPASMGWDPGRTDLLGEPDMCLKFHCGDCHYGSFEGTRSPYTARCEHFDAVRRSKELPKPRDSFDELVEELRYEASRDARRDDYSEGLKIDIWESAFENVVSHAEAELEWARARIVRLTDALRWYGDRENYFYAELPGGRRGISFVQGEGGQAARQALAAAEKERNDGL